MTAVAPHVNEVLDADAGADIFDRIARRRMNMSGDEFLALWDQGKYADVDWDDVPGLVDVAMSLSFVR